MERSSSGVLCAIRLGARVSGPRVPMVMLAGVSAAGTSRRRVDVGAYFARRRFRSGTAAASRRVASLAMPRFTPYFNFTFRVSLVLGVLGKEERVPPRF